MAVRDLSRAILSSGTTDTRLRETLRRRWVVVVWPDRAPLLARLSPAFGRSAWVEVLVDRRHAERRQERRTHGDEQRLVDRRSAVVTGGTPTIESRIGATALTCTKPPASCRCPAGSAGSPGLRDAPVRGTTGAPGPAGDSRGGGAEAPARTGPPPRRDSITRGDGSAIAGGAAPGPDAVPVGRTVGLTDGTPYLAIVERGRAHVYATLREEFEKRDPDLGVQVLWDRRQGTNRRQRTRPVAVERRQHERRGPLPPSWTGLGFVLVVESSTAHAQDAEAPVERRILPSAS